MSTCVALAKLTPKIVSTGAATAATGIGFGLSEEMTGGAGGAATSGSGNGADLSAWSPLAPLRRTSTSPTAAPIGITVVIDVPPAVDARPVSFAGIIGSVVVADRKE